MNCKNRLCGRLQCLSVYEVEELRDLRSNDDGRVKVLVHWKSFSATYDSWKPMSEIHRVVGKIALDFFKAHMKDDPALVRCYESRRSRKRW